MNTSNQIIEECSQHRINKIIDYHYQEMYEALRDDWAEINDLGLSEELYDDELTDQIDDLFRMSETFKYFNQNLLTAAKSQVDDSDRIDLNCSQKTGNQHPHNNPKQLDSLALLKAKVVTLRNEVNSASETDEESTSSNGLPMDVDDILQAIRKRYGNG